LYSARIRSAERARSLLARTKVAFESIALIYLSAVKRKMQDAKLFETWTLQGLLDELDVIELLEAPDHGRILGEITKKQEAIYIALGVQPPSL
jgi:hypothetical protein